MNDSTILLRTYYETLYDRLSPLKEQVVERIDQLLSAEMEKRYAGVLNQEKYDTYLDTCVAFWDERIESYNPTGIQYLFDNVNSKEAQELELQLSWHDSRKDFNELVELVRRKTEPDMTDERMREIVDDIIREVGAYPDQSIVDAYLDKPSLEKVPDYILARAIEEVVRG